MPYYSKLNHDLQSSIVLCVPPASFTRFDSSVGSIGWASAKVEVRIDGDRFVFLYKKVEPQRSRSRLDGLDEGYVLSFQ